MIKTFTADKDFEAMYQAEAWLTQNGYSYGSAERSAPRGIMKGENTYIEKWSRYSKAEQEAFDGLMTGDMRHGPVTVEIFGLADEA